jgi:hypothetical protein
VPRDRSRATGLAEMSPLVTYLREEVEALQKGAGKEFDDALARAHPTLETIHAHGGDPRFVLCVLTSARWRRLRPLGAEFGRWTRLLGQLLGEPALHTLLATEQAPRGMLRQAAKDALDFLQTFHWQDEGILDSRGTGFVTAHKRRASFHLGQVLGVLIWHLREGTTGNFDRLVTLAELVGAFWPVRRSGWRGDDPIPFELVKKRLQRSDKEFSRRFVVTVERVRFHDLHRFLAITLDDQRLTPCGTACQVGIDDRDDPLSTVKIFIESRQPAPGTHGDQESRRDRIQEAPGDPPRFELRVTILDETPPGTGPTQPGPTDDQSHDSAGRQPPEESEPS